MKDQALRRSSESQWLLGQPRGKISIFLPGAVVQMMLSKERLDRPSNGEG